MSASNTTPVWNSSTKGAQPITEMNTVYIKNAISTVERELASTTVSDREGKQSILAALKAEYATRTDA